MNAPLAAVRPGRIAVASAMVESGRSREKHISIVHCASQQYLDDSPLHPCPSASTSAAVCAVWMGIMADMPVHACAGECLRLDAQYRMGASSLISVLFETIAPGLRQHS